MRLDDQRMSENIGDQRGGNFGGGGLGGGGGPLGLIFGLVASKFGIGGILVLGLLMMVFGGNPLGLMGGGSQTATSSTETGASVAQKACTVDAASRFSCQVLGNTEDTWNAIFAEQGQRYTPAGLIFYDGRGQSGCGAAQSAMGPFYCPTDSRIYLDTSFYTELQNKFGAAGDFAQAYVIAHEVGHHIQHLAGTLDRAHNAQARASAREGNAIQVQVELQADCFAGVWGARNRNRLEPGDIEEGLRAASAIGDDTLQKAAGQRPVPESFTHGSAEQRMQWLRRGLETGDPAACNTIS
jgi:predicted metalloprotease